MAEPRRIIPGQTYLATRRTALRTFRLRPHPETTAIILYALAWAVKKHGIDMHGICVMSNHEHSCFHDGRGEAPNFLRDFHRTVAKALNASQGQFENLWSNEKTNLLPIVDDAAFISRMAYLATNPVDAGLVEEPGQWPGINLWEPCVIKVRRPDKYFRDTETFPEELELRITRPERPNFTEEQWRGVLGEAIAERVKRAKEKFEKAGRKFLGAAGIMATSFLRRARSYERKWVAIPKVAANEPQAKTLMLRVRRSFLKAYRSALTRLRQKQREVEFPYGTWMLVRQYGVSVAPVTNPAEALFAFATDMGAHGGGARAAPV
jgi:hypothetical protein